MANDSAAERAAARIGEDGRGRGAGAWLVRAVGVASALTGAIVLVGWIADVPALTTAGAEIAMKANAAVCFVLLGAALWRRSRRGERPDRLAAALAAAAALVGGLTLLEHLLGLDLGIDQLLVHEAPGMPATASPGRMGPPAASSFLLLGTAIAVLDRRGGALRAAVPAVALAVAFAALLPLVGYAYGTRQLYGIARFTGIALPTALLIELIAIAVLVASGLGAALRRPSGATRLARRTLAYSTVVPLVAGWAVAKGLSAGLYDGTFAVSFLVLALILAVTLLTWRDVAHIARLERRRERAEAARRESEERSRARAAELERVSSELREADRRKDAFLAVLSHELRNPLAPIRNSLFVLGHPGAGADRTRRAIEVIERQAGQLTRLVEDLLDLSRISRGKVRLQRARVDLAEIGRRTVEDHRGPAAAAGLELLAELPDAPLWVDGDAARLAQVIGNLLANAVKFTPPGGRIRVAAAREGEGAVVLRVRDTGVGIDEGMRARLFEPFAQADATLDRSRGGLGLGLALVKGLVELHGGAVEARSGGPGTGTELAVTLPLAAAPAPARAPDAAPAAAPLRILIVEDNRDAAQSLRDLLEVSGHEVRVAHAADDGLAAARRARADVVICDVGLPGRSGYDVALALRADAATRDVVLVAVTGYATPDDRRRAIESGFDHHFGKPVDPVRLGEVLREVARRIADGAPAAAG